MIAKSDSSTSGASACSPAARRYSCADSSVAREERCWGTASPARGWLLVEEPGPWGAGTVPDSRLGGATTAALRAAAAAIDARLLLIRRPLGRKGADPDRRALFRARCRRGQVELAGRTASAAELREPSAAAALFAGADDGADRWTPHTDPLLLVCTHGRKDWCCALRGRPVAAALAVADPVGAWECSHLGGDRFAASVLALPTGYMYGRVAEGDAAQLVTSTRTGRVAAHLLRGRSTDALVVQAADAMARAELGRTDVDDLVPAAARRVPDLGATSDTASQTWDVTLAGTGGRPDVRVRLHQRHVEVAARLTCSAEQEQHARTWELLDLTLISGHAG